MRNIYVLVILTAYILMGCKPKSKSFEFKENTSNNTTTSAWSKAYRDKVMEGCVGKAVEKVDIMEATKYCNCITDKVQAKFPNESEVNFKHPDIESMMADCRGQSNSTQTNPSNKELNNNSNNSNNTTQGWTFTDQKDFMNGCRPGAQKTLDSKKAFDYCDCLLGKLMYEYPTAQQANGISDSYLKELASKCLQIINDDN